MSPTIDPLDSPTAQPDPLHGHAPVTPPSSPSSHHTPAPTAPIDQVELSDQELEARAIRDAIDDLPDIREDRLAYLRQLIDSGTYHVPSTQVVDRLVHDVLVNRPKKSS